MIGNNRIYRWVLFLILLAGLIPGLVYAQDSDPTDDEVNAIAKQLYCPVCENTPLDACGTAACEQWRGIIRDKLAEGWTEDQIKDYFVNQYGDRVLAEPPRSGFNWLVYIVPLIIFAGGGFILYRGFTHWKETDPLIPDHNQPGAGPAVESPGDEYIQRVEDELRKRSGGSK